MALDSRFHHLGSSRLANVAHCEEDRLSARSIVADVCPGGELSRSLVPWIQYLAKRSLIFWVALALMLASATTDARPPRSGAAKAEFQRMRPCPETGKSRGACPGWEIDHVTPLKCGGPDTPANMQWLTVEDHKKKTAAEAKSCRRPKSIKQ